MMSDELESNDDDDEEHFRESGNLGSVTPAKAGG
jgi:hypothetical protein